MSKEQLSTSFFVAGYALSSSLLSVINKYAVTEFQFPSALTSIQYATSCGAVWILGRLGFLTHDTFTTATAKKFLPAAIVFNLTIFTNTQLLLHANVETFIVFRSLTPILVAVADTIFRRQPIPSKLTLTSLIIIFAGAAGYVATDSKFTSSAYSWATAYLFTITFEMVYIKHVVTNLGLNTWGFVFYNNLLSLMMAPFLWFLTGEFWELLMAVEEGFRPAAAWAVALSCAFALSISFFGFAARKAVSATAFTVTGVVNKLLTVAVNVAIWDKHAGPLGLAYLLATIAGGFLYHESVTRAKSRREDGGLPPAKPVEGAALIPATSV